MYFCHWISCDSHSDEEKCQFVTSLWLMYHWMHLLDLKCSIGANIIWQNKCFSSLISPPNYFSTMGHDDNNGT